MVYHKKKYIINNTFLKEVDQETGTEKSNTGFRLGFRHVQCTLLFTCLGVAYAMRVNMSVAIVAMSDNSENPDFEAFEWDSKTKSAILSSFLWGYIVTQIPAGPLGRKFGPKILLFYGMLACSLLNLLTPMAAYGNWQLVCALRAIEGLFQGLFFSSVHAILAKWSPVNERGSLGAFCYVGCQFGTVIMLVCSGYINSSGMGWPSIFYSSGIAGLIWCAVWFFYGSNNPTDCNRVSPEEREFIVNSLADKMVNGIKAKGTPLKKVVFSMAFFALVLTHSSSGFETWISLTGIPAYLNGLFGMDIKTSALFSALPYLAMIFTTFLFIFINNFLTSRSLLSLVARRKMFNIISQWVPAILFVVLGYITKNNSTAAIATLVAAVGLSSARYLGFMINHIDLSPNYAGVLMGVSNFVANIVSIVAPITVGFIVHDTSNLEQWRIIFWITATVLFVGNAAFVAFGKSHEI